MNEALQEAAFAEYTAALALHRAKRALDAERGRSERVLCELDSAYDDAARAYESARRAVLDLAKSDVIATDAAS